MGKRVLLELDSVHLLELDITVRCHDDAAKRNLRVVVAASPPPVAIPIVIGLYRRQRQKNRLDGGAIGVTAGLA